MVDQKDQIVSSDDTFISFAFALVSVILLCVYLRWGWGIVSRLINHFLRKSPRKFEEQQNPFHELYEKVVYIPTVILTIFKSPEILFAGFSVLIAQPKLTLTLYLPKFLKFIIRPKILLLWIWALLFVSVMYTKITFDAYAILGLPSSASMSDVKKAYRSLSKQYHPDQNKTEEARLIYHQVKKAYKSLVKRDEFDDEAWNNEELTIGVALPSFLLNKSHDTIVLFGMLGMMLAIPLGIFFKFRGTDNKIPKLLEAIKEEKTRMPIFFAKLGVPIDPKYVEKKASRCEILRVLKLLGLTPPDSDEMIITGFPSFPDFVMRCIEPEKYTALFRALKLGEEEVAILNDWAIHNGEAAVALYEENLVKSLGINYNKVEGNPEEGQSNGNTEGEANPNGTSPSSVGNVNKNIINPCLDKKQIQTIIKTSKSKYRVIRFLMEIYCESIEKTISDLQKYMPSEIRSARRILTLHKEMFENLKDVYESDAPPLPRTVLNLTNLLKEFDKAIGELIPDVNKAIQKHYKQYYEEQMGKKAFRQFQRQMAQQQQQ